MPNNNPHGHNQYTRPELRSQRNKKPSSPPAGTTHPQSPPDEGGSPNHESHDSQESGHEGSHEIVEGRLTPSHALPRAPGTSRRGFASMDAALQREIASKGGHSQGRENNPGNFANDRERARIAGRKGGEAHGHR